MPPFIWVRPKGLGQTVKSQETGRWWRSGRRAIEPIFLPRGLHTSKKPPEASGWTLRVLGRYESSLICANLKVGRKRYKAQRYNRVWVRIVWACGQVRSPGSSLLRRRASMLSHESRPIKVTLVHQQREREWLLHSPRRNRCAVSRILEQWPKNKGVRRWLNVQVLIRKSTHSTVSTRTTAQGNLLNPKEYSVQ